MSAVTLHRKPSLRSGVQTLGLALCLSITPGCEGDDDGDGGSGGQAGAGSGGKAQAGAGSGGQAQSGNGGGGQAQAGRGGQAGAGSGGGQNQAGDGGQSQAGGGSGGEPQAGAGNGGSAGQDLPILERPAELSRDCTITRPVALLGTERWFGGVLLAGEDGPLLLYGQQTPIGQDPIAVELFVSSIDLAGERGEPQELASASGSISNLDVVTTSAGSSAVWLDWSLSGDSSYQLASFDRSGSLLAPPVEIESISGMLKPAFIQPSATGTLLLYGDQSGSDQTVKIATLDAAGQISGTPNTLFSASSGGVFPAGLHRTDDGYLAAYTHTHFDNNDGGTYLVALDTAGVPAGDPLRLGSGSGGIDFFDHGDEILIAWTEQQGGYETDDIAVTLRVGRFDAGGRRLGSDQSLQRPIEDRYNQAPHWVEFGDELGLLWSTGGVIYVCAGCVPDDELQFVLLDGTDFTPKSQLLTLANLTTEGGLTRAEAVRLDDDLLVVSNVQYHTSAESASASVRCVPRE
jgi:hypothetical protein